VIFIEFKKEILRTYVLRMTAKGGLININLSCHSEAVRRISDLFVFFRIKKALKEEILRLYSLRMTRNFLMVSF
jgi:hypothetical protein